MFHQFHGGVHSQSQGSYSSEDFRKTLIALQKQYSVVDANVFLDRMQSRKLQDHEIAITFDDGLRCQYDIALPILEEFDLKAFFFIHTGPVSGLYDNFEYYRILKNSLFENIDDFYQAFFEEFERMYFGEYQTMRRNLPENYLPDLKFYSANDRAFKFSRDKVLSSSSYQNIFSVLCKKRGVKLPNIDEIWMERKQINSLAAHNHIVGLHSHTHSNKIHEFSFNDQLADYALNKKLLEQITGKNITSVSYPCGNFNDETLTIMKDLNVVLGFRNSVYDKEIPTNLKMPRVDSASVRNPD